jgi:hypothetical protein
LFEGASSGKPNPLIFLLAIIESVVIDPLKPFLPLAGWGIFTP